MLAYAEQRAHDSVVWRPRSSVLFASGRARRRRRVFIAGSAEAMSRDAGGMAAFRAEMQESYVAVDAWGAEAILLPTGSQFVKSHAVSTSTHEFTVATTLLANMAPLSNGAVINLFADNDTPLSVMAIYVGYPQERKSQHTKLTKVIGDVVDDHIRSIAETLVISGGEDPSKLQMASSTLTSFTPAVLFERCSGDYLHVRNSEDFKTRGVGEPLFFGRLANVDEVYAALNDLGLTSGDAKKKGQTCAPSQINEHAGHFNRYLQFGECSRVTKTIGSYGEGFVRSTSFALIGNMHPTIAVPMEREEIGNHTGATKERALFHTAPRVQPHDELPTGYMLPPGVPKWSWVDLDVELARLSGLEQFLDDPEAAARSTLLRASRAPSMGAGSASLDVSFHPDEDGYLFTLPDGVESRLRYRMGGGSAVAQFRVANRDFPTPQSHCLKTAARRVLLRFKQPNRRLVRDADATRAFTSLATLYNVKAAMAADMGNDADAALWGIAPWKLGVMVGLLVSFDVFVGQAAPGEDGVRDPIVVSSSYVERARKWLDVLHAVRAPWRKGTRHVAPPDGRSAIPPGLPPTVQAQVPLGFVAPRGLANFPATQEPAHKRPRRRMHTLGASTDGVDAGAGSQAHAGGDTDECVGPGESLSGEGAGKTPSAEVAVPDCAPRPKDAQAGVPMDVGYGPNGSSAQTPSGENDECFWKDRVVMQRTVLRGKPVVTVAEMCGILRQKRGAHRPGMPKAAFEEVMAAGFKQWPVGKLVDAGTGKARVVFSKPPAGDRDAMTHFHNMLVDLCQVSLRQFSRALTREGAAADDGAGTERAAAAALE